MNSKQRLKLVTGKLNLICRYCDEGLEAKALSGMGDVNEALMNVVSQLLDKSVKVRIDEGILIGSLTLALDAMQKGDLKGLSAALREGVAAELEKAVACSDLPTVQESGTDAGVPEFPPSSCTVCLFGYGDGSFYEALCAAAAPDSTFIVYEPETDTIVELREQLQQSIDYYRLDTMQVLATPGYDTVFRTEYAEFVHAINENRERILVNRNTLRRFKDTASRNVITNLHILEHCNLVDELAHILPQSVPVIIVSAGPSLDRNIELLKEAKGHCLIFAVDTAMKYLMEHDIMPDLGITVEPVKPMANYADDRCFDVPHIFDCESNPEIVSRERGRIFIYNCRDYVRRLLEAAGIEVADDVASGGSVATAAFAICYQLQMKTVIMIGQDLAYQGTATHAGGVESAGINGDIGYDTVDGIDGGQVRTRSDWKGYLRWFENGIRVINDQKLDMTVVDATEGGALIHGSHVMTLKAAIEKYCADVEYDFAAALTRLPYVVEGRELARLKELAARSFDELAEVKQAATEAVAVCDEAVAKKAAADARLAQLRRRCESALMYPLINNYAVSDIIDEVSELRRDVSDPSSEVKQQRLAFEAIAGACDYFTDCLKEMNGNVF